MKSVIDQIRKKLQLEVEDELKRHVSENVLNEVHEKVFKPVNMALSRVKRQLLPNELLIVEQKILELRLLLDQNPKERTIQDRLLELENVTRVRTACLSEVFVQKKSGATGRIDILAYSKDSPTTNRIIELKRPSFKLISYKGLSRQRVSSPLKRTLIQVGQYQASKLKIYERNAEISDIRLNELRKTVVAGRKFSLPGPYIIIAEEEKNNSLDIYSWDAWIDRLERLNS